MKNMIKALILTATIILAIPIQSQALNVSWTSPTNNLDGSTLNIGGYKVYYGNVSHAYATTSDVGNVLSTSIPNTSFSGVVYFAISAYDVNNNEGILSDETAFYDYIPLPPSISSYTYSAKLGKATINVNAPTLNTDGTSVGSQVKGYIIGYGQISRATSVYTNFIYSSTPNYSLTVPTNSGTWYTSISATNQFGNIGAYSSEASFGTGTPNKPGKPKTDIIDLR